MKLLTEAELMRQVNEKPAAQQKRVDDFNQKYEVGTPVVAFFGSLGNENGKKESKTSSLAFMLGGHTAAVMLECGGGAVSLTHVYPVDGAC